MSVVLVKVTELASHTPIQQHLPSMIIHGLEFRGLGSVDRLCDLPPNHSTVTCTSKRLSQTMCTHIPTENASLQTYLRKYFMLGDANFRFHDAAMSTTANQMDK